jgi:preprotein translocase subunit SecA
VEGHNFDTRKQLVEYDDVMNKHREAIYSRRRKALEADRFEAEILGMVQAELEAMVQAHTNERTGEVDFPALRDAVMSIMPVTQELADQLERSHPTELAGIAMDEARRLYQARVDDFTPPVMKMVERFTFISALDRLWIEHLEAMDSLRGGIGLRAIGQRDPLVEYKREGFRMFKQLMGLLDAEVATSIFKVQINREALTAAPVETALTKAAEKAHTNAPDAGVATAPGESGGGASGSRAERRARAHSAANESVVARSATKQTNKKHKKRR